jgi:hypothetical protein
MKAAEHWDTFCGASVLFPQIWIHDVMSNTCWYLDNLTVPIKAPSYEKLTSIVPKFRKGPFYSKQF